VSNSGASQRITGGAAVAVEDSELLYNMGNVYGVWGISEYYVWAGAGDLDLFRPIFAAYDRYSISPLAEASPTNNAG